MNIPELQLQLDSGIVSQALHSEATRCLSQYLSSAYREAVSILVAHGYMPAGSLGADIDATTPDPEPAMGIWRRRDEYSSQIVLAAARYLWWWEVGTGNEPYGHEQAVYLVSVEGPTAAAWHCLGVMYNYWIACDGRGWLVNTVASMEPFFDDISESMWRDTIAMLFSSHEHLRAALMYVYSRGSPLRGGGHG